MAGRRGRWTAAGRRDKRGGLAKDDAAVPKTPIPTAVLVYGLLGLIPFLLPPLLGVWIPAHAGAIALVALGYGALILSFLGGARWGLEVAAPKPAFGVVSLSMLPTLAGLALLLAPWLARPVQLTAISVLLALQMVWDVRSKRLPGWYPRLRVLLTMGAVAGLIAMALVVARAAAAVDPGTMV
ncbi:MAG: DUF3429 domain-containing protein [Sandarakinorhabdus sp.]|nr:DUF3429 domain-containing protein [Sandarakinorhabdus sp.]